MQSTTNLLFHAANVLMQAPMAAAATITILAPRHARVTTCLRQDVDGASSSPVLYLTFDDGPTPSHTELLLTSLERAKARATFFVTTTALGRDPRGLRSIIEAGHAIGSHGHEHRDAWMMTKSDYVADVETSISRLAAEGVSTKLYRPPFGRIRPALFPLAREYGFNVVGWDVMPGDFRRGATSELVVDSAKRSVRDGSIVVLHDNRKMLDAGITIAALDELLTYYSAHGWSFEALPTS